MSTATTFRNTGKTWTIRVKEDTKMNFYGYKRPDGRVGVRNKVLILPASVCASDTTRIISQQVVGSVTFNNQLGCSQVASDQQFTMDVMAGYAANPNVYGTVVVSLGCENCQMDLVVEAIRERTNKPLKQVIIQEAGGTLAVNSVPGQGTKAFFTLPLVDHATETTPRLPMDSGSAVYLRDRFSPVYVGLCDVITPPEQ